MLIHSYDVNDLLFQCFVSSLVLDIPFDGRTVLFRFRIY